MKIGILTMNYSKNYGGILQTYGMYKCLSDLGHEVVVINYKNSGRRNLQNVLVRLSRLASKGKKTKTSDLRNPQPLTEKYLKNFILFKSRYLNYSKPVDEYSISDLGKKLDAVVIGSDQIWNDVYSNKLIYYFDWTFAGIKIAYAACTILSNPPYLLKNKLKRLLNSFDLLTVRDNNTSHYVESITSKVPALVVDPSCLYDYEDFITENPINEPYILMYILGNEIQGGILNALNEIKKKIGNLLVVCICIPSESMVATSVADVIYKEATPKEWVNLFYHSSFVFTDSFHGIMFSLKFKKQFIAYSKDVQRMSRLQDLIDRYSLFNIINNSDAIQAVFSKGVVDYEVVSNKLSHDATLSKKYLQDALFNK